MMTKNFQAQTYIVDNNLSDTLSWLCQHQECFDSFHYDAIRQTLIVFAALLATNLNQALFHSQPHFYKR